MENFRVGQTFRFKHDEETFKNEEIFTIIAVSPFVEMVKIEGGWVWIDGIEIVEDQIDDTLEFLGLN